MRHPLLRASVRAMHNLEGLLLLSFSFCKSLQSLCLLSLHDSTSLTALERTCLKCLALAMLIKILEQFKAEQYGGADPRHV